MAVPLRHSLLNLLAGILLLVCCGGEAWAHSTYEGCKSCHGDFREGGYVSLVDNTDWGRSLMVAHRDWMGGECQACHNPVGMNFVWLNDSGSDTFPKSCVGCHGRDEDVTGQCTGQAGSSDGVEAECGSGAGLRAMHELNVGAGTCSNCHAGDPMPVGEHVKPFNYKQAESSVADPCDADGSESQIGPTGLDNDGDGQRDGNDADCSGFVINPGLTDAWFNPATAGQGFLITVFQETGIVFLAWFTYDLERPPQDVIAHLGEPGHRWLTAQGPYDGDTAVLDVYVSSGGVFDSTEPAVGPPVKDGTLTIHWTGCNSGIVSYDLASAGQGMIPIERIVLDNVALCEALQ